MHRIASWAADHRRPARFLVVLCYLLINLAGIGLSLLLPDDTRLAAWLILAAILGSGWALSAYAGANCRPAFRQRSARSLVLCAATLLFVAGNTTLQLQPVQGPHSMMASMQAATMSHHAPARREAVLKERLHEARKWLNEQSTGMKVFLIVMTVLIAAGMMVFWAALCCGIVCQGLEALGYSLFFAGLGGAIFGCVRVIQRILRGGPRPRKARSGTP